jgi:hypothetical protein
MQLIIDLSRNEIIAQVDDDQPSIESGYIAIEQPDGFTMDTVKNWFYEDGQLTYDPENALLIAKRMAIARIKAEAAELITATDWKVQRAQEREKAGFSTLAETAAVLTEREAIRRSSNAAEQRLNLLTDRFEIDEFDWTVDVQVMTNRLLTQKQFADRFTDAELSQLITIAKTNPAMSAWFERFHAALEINLDLPMAQNGVWMLENTGLIATGRATEILR